MTLPIVNLANHIAGDSWIGIPAIGPFTINGVAPATPAARVRLQLTRVPSAPGAAILFDTDAGTITIVDAANWEASMPPVAFQNFGLPPGNYEGHLEYTDTAGVRLTTHDVRLTILPDKTP